MLALISKLQIRADNELVSKLSAKDSRQTMLMQLCQTRAQMTAWGLSFVGLLIVFSISLAFVITPQILNEPVSYAPMGWMFAAPIMVTMLTASLVTFLVAIEADTKIKLLRLYEMLSSNRE